ncbi:hypothetical protein QWJ26_08095 [Streptomyces sp. CSDS2]|uniref:hypothetical protein n=1 Tax=Streptomyces sp. CSDS2 TaxID=3055051 RepID=UPI0025B0BADE|nr:hypothetical protein [Streptomyces sp. CSDS2]MDN3259774.1 hypothetical protein [Streptomyces sp. CSDS2]
MPEITQLTDLDALIGDLETRITEDTLLPSGAYTEGCSGVCTVIVCDTVVICSGIGC